MESQAKKIKLEEEKEEKNNSLLLCVLVNHSSVKDFV